MVAHRGCHPATASSFAQCSNCFCKVVKSLIGARAELEPAMVMDDPTGLRHLRAVCVLSLRHHDNEWQADLCPICTIFRLHVHVAMLVDDKLVLCPSRHVGYVLICRTHTERK